MTISCVHLSDQHFEMTTDRQGIHPLEVTCLFCGLLASYNLSNGVLPVTLLDRVGSADWRWGGWGRYPGDSYFKCDRCPWVQITHIVPGVHRLWRSSKTIMASCIRRLKKLFSRDLCNKNKTFTLYMYVHVRPGSGILRQTRVNHQSSFFLTRLIITSWGFTATTTPWCALQLQDHGLSVCDYDFISTDVWITHVKQSVLLPTDFPSICRCSNVSGSPQSLWR